MNYRFHSIFISTVNVSADEYRQACIEVGFLCRCAFRRFRHVRVIFVQKITGDSCLLYWNQPRKPQEVRTLPSIVLDDQESDASGSPRPRCPWLQRFCRDFRRGTCAYSPCKFSHGLTMSVYDLYPVPMTADELDVGDPCWARYPDDGLWYPGTVEAVNTGSGGLVLTVRYKQYSDTTQVCLVSVLDTMPLSSMKTLHWNGFTY